MENNQVSLVWHTDSLWQSAEVNHICSALQKFHAENITIEKKGEASISQSVKRKYVKLDDIMNTVRPVLAKYECYVEQHLAGDSVVTRVVHVSGQFIASKYHYQTWESSHVNNLQRLGGGLTYLKRYAVSAILNIVADEDTDGDGNDSIGYKQPSGSVKPNAVTQQEDDGREWLNLTTKTGSPTAKGDAAKKFVQGGGSLADVLKKYKVNKADLAVLQALERHAQSQGEVEDDGI